MRNKFITKTIIIMMLLALSLIPGCVASPSQYSRSGSEKQTEISYLKFEEIPFSEGSYKILKFVDEDVEQEDTQKKRFYSSKDNMAVTVEFYEGNNINFEDIINASLGYLQGCLNSFEKVSEEENQVHYHIEYELMGEKKTKDVVCKKISDGIILHDLSLFADTNQEEEKIHEEVTKEFLQYLWYEY